MDIFSKIKKFEEADYFNQNLSNVLIDEDRDKFTIGHELIEESDYFNQNLSNVLIDEDRDKFTIDHELIDDSDYFNSNLSNVLLDTSSDIFADSFVLNDEEFDFFNQNLSNALIEDVDLDSIVDTLSLVETANQQSAIKYYKVEITKTPNNYTSATLSNGRFNGLRFKETTSTFETNAISENVVFTDSNNRDINAVVEYLNGRTESNNNSYNPSAFFVEDISQSWGGTPWNTIEGDSNEDLVYRITFQTKIQRSDIESLTFNDINDDNVPVKFKLFVSNDLETWELLDSTTLSFNTDDNEYHYDSTNVHPEGKYKIVLTATNDANGTSPGIMCDGKFEHLTYVECLSPRSATATSENIVFSDDDGKTYNCTVSLSSRWSDNGSDDYAPHNLFALDQSQRVSSYTQLYPAGNMPLTVIIQFTDDIRLELLQGLRIAYAGTTAQAKYTTYALYDEDDTLLYHEENVNQYLTDFVNNRHYYTLTYNFNVLDPADTWKIILTLDPNGTQNNYKNYNGGLSLGKFTNLDYVECLTPQSYNNLSEDIVFTDGNNNYNCTVSVNGRYDYTQQDYYAPHNFFAPSGKRSCPESNLYNNYHSQLIVTVEFTTPIAFSKIKSLNFRMGYETLDAGSNIYAPNSVQYDLYNGDDELAYTTTKLLADADSNRDITIVASLNSESENQDDVNHKFKIEFTNLTVGQYIYFRKTSITGLEFYENRVTNRKTDIVKVYKDTEGNEFPVHIYVVPSVDHNYYDSNGFDDVYFYKANTSSSDKIVIEFDTLINNINAIGKTIHFEAPGDQSHNNFTLNVYSDDTLLYSDTRVFDMAVDVEINTDSQN